MTDLEVLLKIKQIECSDLSPEEKYKQLDTLTFEVWNKHPDGMAARVLDEISKAIQELGE